jgi:hypothetical protein
VSDDVDMVVVRSRRRVTVCLMSVLELFAPSK